VADTSLCVSVWNWYGSEPLWRMSARSLAALSPPEPIWIVAPPPAMPALKLLSA
jgi:hypothetical protein